MKSLLSNSRVLKTIAAMALLAGAAFGVHAQELKIGYVNSDRVLRDAAPAKAAQAKLEAEFSKRQREGDVRELVLSTDDMFVVSKPGDEIAVSFDARLPALPDGWTRTFLMYADGFSKEMNLNSASPDQLDPLPFHGMKEYPYAPSTAPTRTSRYQEYLDRFNTRIVKRTLPPLELSRRISHEP